MKYQQTTFQGGISSDVRDTSLVTCGFTNNFDLYTYNHKLVPQYNMVDDDAGTSSGNMKRVTRLFSVATSTNSYYGMANDSGTMKFHIKDNDDMEDAWGSSQWSSTNATFNPEMFIYYKPADAIYYYDGSSSAMGLEKHVPGGATTRVAFTSATVYSKTDAIINPNDNKMYFATNTSTGVELHRVDTTGTFSQDILGAEIPQEYRVKNLDVHGVYLVMFCESNVGSVAYIIDTDLADPLPVDIIDFGMGEMFGGASIKNTITAAMLLNQEHAEPSVVIKTWTGGDETKELIRLRGTAVTPSDNTKTAKVQDNILYFAAKITDCDRTLNNETGIWATDGQRLWLDTEDSELAIADYIESFDMLGDYRFIATSNDDARITSTAAYGTAEYVTNKITSVIIGSKLDPMYVAVRTEPLPAGAGVVVYHRTDENMSWTKIIDESDDNSIVAKTDASSGGSPLEEGYEHQFSIVSTGGAVITGLYAEFDEDNE